VQGVALAFVLVVAAPVYGSGNDPVGYLDSAVYAEPNLLSLWGWAVDPDTTGLIKLSISTRTASTSARPRLRSHAVISVLAAFPPMSL